MAAACLAVVALTGQGTFAAPGDSPPGSSQAQDPAEQAGGGALPGERPDEHPEPQVDSDGLPIVIADPAPPLNPNFVDRYAVLVRSVARGKKSAARLAASLADSRATLKDSSGDMTMALRERGRADQGMAQAESEVNQAVRDLYITGSTDMGVVIGVLGSKPEDLLRTLDSLAYVSAATGSEAIDYEMARAQQLIATSAAATLVLRTRDARDKVSNLSANLARTRRILTKEEKELARLVAAAAPQTVVGRKGCPTSVMDGTVPAGVSVERLCERAVAQAASPQAASAIKWALVRLGAPYACGGVGRLAEWRYDCSSYVSRAYHEAAGMETASDGWAPSTRNMVPWDGAGLDPHYLPIPPESLAPGDLVLYDTCPEGETCPYRHVVMYLGTAEKGGVPMMAHTNTCGGVAHIEPFTGTSVPTFLGARRVVTLPGERLVLTDPQAKKPGKGSSHGGKKDQQ